SSQVTGVADWHINSDEPAVLDYNTEFKSAAQLASLYAPDEFRISDHDPVVVGLSLTNAAPVVGAVTVPVSPVSVGTSVTVGASFTDADRLDTHTAVVDWGDGATSAGTVTEGSGVSAGSVSGSHTYRAAGFYTVEVTVTDGFGHSGSNSSSQIVVYDRSAGQVTGAGSIASPKGAWVSQPSASGKGRFAFAVGYRATRATPFGVFGYVVGGSPRNRLALAATSYDYLVITGATARFAGSAQVNGESGFRYEVTAADVRRADTLRIVVRTASGALVYDSATQTVSGEIATVP
ncbi:MAG: PKD domain-containing protein, partial [Terracoccus sp.]